MRALVAVIGAVTLTMAGAACAPDKADVVALTFAGDTLHTDDRPPGGGETILTVKNLSDVVIRPALVAVDGEPRAVLASGDRRAIDVVARSGDVSPRRQEHTAIAAKVHVDEARFHLYLEPGTYVLLVNGLASFGDGHWVAFDVA